MNDVQQLVGLDFFKINKEINFEWCSAESRLGLFRNGRTLNDVEQREGLRFFKMDEP